MTVKMTQNERLPVRPWAFAAVGVIGCVLWAFPAFGQEGTGAGTGTGVAATSVAELGSGASPAPIDPGAIEVVVEGPESPVTVGQLIPVRIRLGLPAGVHFGTIETVGPGRLEFVDRQVDARQQPDETTEVVAEMTFVAFRPGRHRIDGFDVRFLLPDGSAGHLLAEGTEVVVHSVIANEQDPQLRPEKGGVPVLYRDYTLAWVAGIGSAFLAMGLMVFLIARSRPRTIEEVPPPPPRPAHEVALEKLDAIVADKLIEQDRTMEFHVRLSEAVREYLGNRYGFQGLDMTTTEIVSLLEGVRLPARLGDQFVSHLLYGCDLVKFAKQHPGQLEEEEALEQAYKLVRTTMLPDWLTAEPGPGAQAEQEEGP